jgi:dihydrofolate reductase
VEIVYYVAASLDGFIATPDGGIEWLKPFEGCAEDYGDAPSKAAKQIAADGIRRAWLVGGGKLAAALRAEGLITEYIVSLIPVLLGAGIPLFDGPAAKQALRLAQTKTYESGIVQLRYVNP